MFKNFKPNEMHLIKIKHPVYKEYKTIGKILEEKEDLNICKIIFKDRNGKIKTEWFHFFTGKIVSLPKKNERWAKEKEGSDQTGYQLTNEKIYNYEIFSPMFNLRENVEKPKTEELKENEPKKRPTRKRKEKVKKKETEEDNTSDSNKGRSTKKIV